MPVNIVSLYDESGNMLRPWAEVGFHCYCVDILNDNRTERVGKGYIYYVQADMLEPQTLANVIALKPMLIVSFPPCTDLANCGAKHFPAKRAVDPEFQVKAIKLFRLPFSLAEQCECECFAENPISAVSTLWRKPDYRFNPSDYGGYLPEDDVHPRWPDYLPPRDGYPKLTMIWKTAGVIIPAKQPVPSVRHYPGWEKLGGKSAKTKQIRSETPRGWARAFYCANWQAVLAKARSIGLELS